MSVTRGSDQNQKIYSNVEDMDLDKDQTQNKEGTAEEESEGGSLLFLTIFILAANIVKDVVDIWVPGYIAMGVSCFIVGLAFYPFRETKRDYSLPKWALLLLLYASALTAICWIIYLLFGYSF